MTQTLNAHQTKTETLSDGASMTVEIRTNGATDVTTQIDDDSGGTPATYDYVQSFRPTDDDEGGDGDVWMRYDSDSAVTNVSYVDPATAGYYRFELTNQSGSQATFRVRAVAWGGD